MKSLGRKLNARKRRAKINAYLSKEEYANLKFSVVTKRPQPHKLIKSEEIASHKLRQKIRQYAYSYRIKENPIMIPTVLLKIRRYIKETAKSYIPRLL